MRSFIITFLLALMLPFLVKGQFAPPAGQPGTTAIYKDSSVFVNWATHCEVNRGWQNIADTTLGRANVGDSSMACGQAGTNGVVSLGDGGSAVLTFAYPISNGPSWDFAVFENSFSDTFLELAFVEVSSDGINYFRFPSTSLTDTTVQVDAFGSLDATKINNLAGKYRALYGTPFDLEELSAILSLDINHITHIRIVDVVGSLNKQYASYDALGHPINDPWPTPYNSSGIDLDAVGVIHQDISSLNENEGANQLIVFPNPCTSQLNIHSSFPLRTSLLDMNGRILKEIIIANKNIVIRMEDLQPGLYLLRIVSERGTEYHKIIKT
ncbi:MAG: T9SS type A sorting domain-containing protein [Bacteroidota bacterium]